MPVDNGNIQWSAASPWWSEPFTLGSLPGSGNMQAQDDIVTGNILTQGFWRGNQGWYRTVPIVNGDLDWASASAWSGPISINTMPGSGSMQAQENIITGNTMTQGVWRGNQGWYRTVPIVNGVIDWNSASPWYGPISISTMPGSGSMQAQSSTISGSTLTQGIWRGNQGWYRTVPIVNGIIDWNSASPWYGPISISTMPGNGDMQAQTGYVLP